MGVPGATAARLPLKTLLGDYPATGALRRGELASSLVSLACADVAVPNKAFKRVVRDLEFDVAELALMTFLIARSRGVPLSLFPVVLFSRNPLPHLICDSSRRRLVPRGLHGSRVGVRSYTTTTAVWIRALLAERCDADLAGIEWVTLEEGHVAGVPDPPNVHRDASGAELMTMLQEGAIDAAIVDPVPADPRFVSVVPDPDAAWNGWQREHSARTVNHVVVVRDALAADAALMRELFRLFRDSRELAGAAVDRAATPIGFDEIRRTLDVAIAVAAGEGLLARPLTAGDLVNDVLAALS